MTAVDMLSFLSGVTETLGMVSFETVSLGGSSWRRTPLTTRDRCTTELQFLLLHLSTTSMIVAPLRIKAFDVVGVGVVVVILVVSRGVGFEVVDGLDGEEDAVCEGELVEGTVRRVDDTVGSVLEVDDEVGVEMVVVVEEVVVDEKVRDDGGVGSGGLVESVITRLELADGAETVTS